jgi:hypothetical protein
LSGSPASRVALRILNLLGEVNYALALLTDTLPGLEAALTPKRRRSRRRQALPDSLGRCFYTDPNNVVQCVDAINAQQCRCIPGTIRFDVGQRCQR